MHFRHVDDEILFGRLKAQLIQSLQGAPPHMITNVLRVLGRIESVAFYEGIRQGVVARGIDEEVGPSGKEDLSPIALHALVYNGAFTPLVEAEDRYIKRVASTAADDILFRLHGVRYAAEPLEMPPMTLAEALAAPTGTLVALAKQPRLTTTGLLVTDEDEDEALASAVKELEDGGTLNSYIKDAGDPSDDFSDVINAVDFSNVFSGATLTRTDGSTHVTQPSFIERCRDALQARMQTGWAPAGWADVVFAARDELKADAFAIDLNLSTDVGKSMLRSIGLFDIADALLDAATIDAMLRDGHAA